MTVRAYYTKHFDELSQEAQLHFATRLKNWYRTDEFLDFFQNNEPTIDLSEIFHNKDYSTVDNLELCRPYFEKYPKLYGLSAALLQVDFFLNEYEKDLRPDLLALIHKEELHALADELIADDITLATLTPYAISTICLVEILFPRSRNVFAELAAKLLHLKVTPPLITYLISLLIILDTDFYTRPLNPNNLPVYRPLVQHCKTLIETNLISIPLATKLAFLVACKIVNAAATPDANASNGQPVSWPNAPTGFLPLVHKIHAECQASLLRNPYLIDQRSLVLQASLEDATELNTLFILSGLDSE